jgi:peptide/nickel transport system permease protein
MSLNAILTRPSLLVGSLIVLTFFGAAVFAPLLAPPIDSRAPQYIPRYGSGPIPEPPGPEHPLGLLSEKYDVYYGLIWGTRLALGMGLTIAIGRALVGIFVGLLAGTFGGMVDAILMRIADAFMAFPMVAAIVVMLSLFGFVRERWAPGLYMLQPSRQDQILMLAMVVFGWVPYARLMRGNVLVEREKTYIKAARSIGMPSPRLILRHLFPNSTYGLIALITSDIGAVIVLLTAFTFIGIITEDVGAMQADWGLMLSSSRNWIIGHPSEAFRYWYTYMPASLAIVLFSTGWSLVGDGLRDALDPRLRSTQVFRKHRRQVRAEAGTPVPETISASPGPFQVPEDTPPRRTHGSGTLLDDQAAYAWLEHLAERQGATEALLLKPEERRQSPPDWIHTTGVYTPNAALPTPGDNHALLMQGRQALEQGDLPQALAHYTRLIRSGQNIPEVIQDLSRARNRFPRNVDVLQCLGDAHLRRGNHQLALEAYGQAEKLLQLS